MLKSSGTWKQNALFEMNLPIVNHPEYVAKINENSIFPIKKFSSLADYLLKNKVVKEFYIPKECSIETLSKSHSINYINHIKNQTLDKKSETKQKHQNRTT